MPWRREYSANSLVISFCSSREIAASSSPETERRIRPTPVQMMYAATASATSGSSSSHPVANTSATPEITPIEVHTSVMRCLPSASSVMLWWRRPARCSTSAVARLIAVAAALIPRPRTAVSSGCGWRSRGIAVAKIPPAASTISAPSMPAEKYSAFEWPYWWPSSGGAAASRSIDTASSAAARFTKDSSASDSSPTEPVSHQASNLSAIVASAAATDSQA